MSDVETENEIRARLAQNDPFALDLIWTTYASDLLVYLVSILCSRHDAEDALQQVFVTIAQKRSAVAGARKLKPYLFQLGRNVALNRLKKDKRRREKERASSHWIEPEAGVDEHQIEQLEVALAALPEHQRSVVTLKHFRNKTFREMAELLGISENTAASRYRYGIAKLKDSIKKDLP